MSKALILIGLPGSGKSTLCRHLAVLTGYPGYDLDDEIQKSSGLSPEQWIRQHGVDAFREQEFEHCQRLLNDQPAEQIFFLSLGGGSVEHPRLCELISTLQVCYLNPPFETIEQRLSKDPKTRPLFENEGLENLFKRRHILYQQLASFSLEYEATPLSYAALLCRIFRKQNKVSS